MPVTIHDLRAFKQQGRRFAMLTAYDYPIASILDEAGVPVLLVGDTLTMVTLGFETTVPATMESQLHHTQAVVRAVKNALVVGDMPFGSYGVSMSESVRNAARFLKEGGTGAVKFEGPFPELTERLTAIGIPVMGHLGLTPQSTHSIGGFRIQGKTDEAAERLVRNASELEEAGAFALVLEAVPAGVAKRVTESLRIPTIGIGAGPHCDAQVLVINDLLGLWGGRYPKYVKKFADLRPLVADAVNSFVEQVESGAYPDEAHSYA